MSKNKIIVAPSLLSADFLHLEDELNKLHDLTLKFYASLRSNPATGAVLITKSKDLSS